MTETDRVIIDKAKLQRQYSRCMLSLEVCASTLGNRSPQSKEYRLALGAVKVLGVEICRTTKDWWNAGYKETIVPQLTNMARS